MDSLEFRKIVGHFATGVTVITTHHDDLWHGMTANAFCSLSLDPLLVLVCIDRTATCHRQVLAAGRFGVNVLAQDQVEISNRCAKRQEPQLGKLEGVATHLNERGVPIVEGAIVFLDCDLHARHDGGDHDIFVGRVISGWSDSPSNGSREPLLFFRGRYGAIAPME